MPKHTHARYERGFTLVELLVVIGIIAILAALTLVALESVWEHKDREEALVMIDRLYTAIEEYKTQKPYPWMDDAGDYPEEDTKAMIIKDEDGDAATTDSILDKLGEYLPYDREFLQEVNGENVLVDPWDQPYLYDDVSGATSRPHNGYYKSKDTFWQGLGDKVRRARDEVQIIIFSCGADNYDDSSDQPDDWNEEKLLYRKE